MPFARLKRIFAQCLFGESMMITTKPNELQPWHLSEKFDVDPRALVQHDSDQLGKVFLAFALAFNDMKGMVLFEQYLIAMGRPATTDWSAHAGQWRGAMSQMHRWLAGVLHEVIVVIQKNESLVKGAEFERLVGMLSSKSRAEWVALRDAALNTSGDTAQLLNRIRNNASFHYGPKDLGEGFKKQFVIDANATPGPANQTAQYCYGPDMDGTRFFYADAAAQQRMMMLGLQFGAPETDHELVLQADRVNTALVPLIRAFIFSRTQASAAMGG